MFDLRHTSVLAMGMALIRAYAQSSHRGFFSSFLYFFALQYFLHMFYRIFIYPHYFSPLRHIPGPTDNLPLLGQFRRIVKADSPYEVFLEWSARWPDEPFIRYLGLFNKEVLLVNTPEAHKEVLMTYHNDFKKPSLFRNLVLDITGPGSLLFAEGEESKRYRKILSEPFSVPKLKVIFSVFQEKAEVLAQHFEENLDGNGEGVFDVARLLAKMGLDVAGLTLLGLELKNLNSANPKYDFHRDYKRVFQPTKFSSVISLIHGFVPIRKFLPIDTSYLDAIARIRDAVTDCVHSRMQDIEAIADQGEKFSTNVLPNGGRDLLTLIVDERRNFKRTSDALSVSEMVDQLVTFLPAGHETIAGAMTWACYTLAMNPRVQEKLRAEIVSMLDSLPESTKYPSWTDVDRLTYLNNFSKEIVRLYPTATISYREPTKDITICEQFLPKNTPLHFVWAVPSQSKDTWGPDADQVVPERWEHLSGKAADPYAWQTFACGPRFCPGKAYALMEMKAFLTTIVPMFHFTKSEQIEKLGGKHPAYINPALTLWPREGMDVKLKRV